MIFSRIGVIIIEQANPNNDISYRYMRNEDLPRQLSRALSLPAPRLRAAASAEYLFHRGNLYFLVIGLIALRPPVMLVCTYPLTEAIDLMYPARNPIPRLTAVAKAGCLLKGLL